MNLDILEDNGTGVNEEQKQYGILTKYIQGKREPEFVLKLC